MKIEKISDNQIRCTLSHQDLAERELKLSELAYGFRKSKGIIQRYDAAGFIRIWF